MKRLIVVLTINLFIQGILFSEPTKSEYISGEGPDGKKINYTFVSSNGNNKIEYEGLDGWGSGIFYKNNKNISNKLIELNFWNVGPTINWYGDDIAQIWVYLGTGFYDSYIYLFKYDILTENIYGLIDIIYEMELLIHTEDLTNIIIRDIRTWEIKQIVKIEGINGISLCLNGINKIEITDNEIILYSDIEPNTYEILDRPRAYKFKRRF